MISNCCSGLHNPEEREEANQSGRRCWPRATHVSMNYLSFLRLNLKNLDLTLPVIPWIKSFWQTLVPDAHQAFHHYGLNAQGLVRCLSICLSVCSHLPGTKWKLASFFVMFDLRLMSFGIEPTARSLRPILKELRPKVDCSHCIDRFLEAWLVSSWLAGHAQ